MPITISGSDVSTGTSRDRPGTARQQQQGRAHAGEGQPRPAAESDQVATAPSTSLGTGTQPSGVPSSGRHASRAAVSPSPRGQTPPRRPAGVRAGLSTRPDLRSGVSCAATGRRRAVSAGAWSSQRQVYTDRGPAGLDRPLAARSRDHYGIRRSI